MLFFDVDFVNVAFVTLVVIITAICLYFLTWKRIKNSSNIARLFYILSIVAFYVGLFKSSSPTVFVALLEGVTAGFLWFVIGLIIERFSSKKQYKQTRSPIVPVADEIKKLSQLKDEGIVTEEEFNQQKKKLLSN